MKPKLKIHFCDFWRDFGFRDNLFYHLLETYYDIELSTEPDVLIYSCYGFEHFEFHCHKIFYTGENVRPNFRECDFAISFDYNDYQGKNFRMPLYRWRGDLDNLCKKIDAQKVLAEKTKFCCMVVSNGTCRERNIFFEKLSKYKQVDSGGKYLNNVGGSVADKIEFIKDYKFVLSFENSSYPGYTTEKIVEPMIVNSLPVYWGNPEIQKDFNQKSFINVHNYSSFDKAIEEIIKIDRNDELFCEYLERSFFLNNELPATLRFEFIGENLKIAIDSFQNKPPVSNLVFSAVYQCGNKYKKKLLAKLFRKAH